MERARQTSGKWIKDGFITYGTRDWHFFPNKGKSSSCNSVLAHQRGWDTGEAVLPETATKLNTCLKCKKESAKYSLNPVELENLPKVEVTCSKIQYLNQAEADQAMIHMLSRDNKHVRREKKSYYCTDCFSWHLTSKA